jgi:hypothetical protein
MHHAYLTLSLLDIFKNLILFLKFVKIFITFMFQIPHILFICHGLHSHVGSFKNKIKICYKNCSWTQYSDLTTGRKTGIRLPVEAGIFLFATAFRPPIQWVPGALSPAIKRSGREADHSRPLVPRLRMSGAVPPHPPYVFVAWC